VVDGKTLSALPEAERGTLGKVEPMGLYLAIEYSAGDMTGKDYRQIGPAYRLTTEQAQALLGQKVCIFEKAP